MYTQYTMEFQLEHPCYIPSMGDAQISRLGNVDTAQHKRSCTSSNIAQTFSPSFTITPSRYNTGYKTPAPSCPTANYPSPAQRPSF